MVMVHEWTKSTFDPKKEIEIDKIFKAAVKLALPIYTCRWIARRSFGCEAD